MFNNQDWALAGFNPFIQKTFIAAPNTTIINRAQVEAGSLKALGGVERIPIRGFNQLRDESGPSGEPVYEVSNKDSRIRLVGSGWAVSSAASGSYVFNATTNNYAEITFYGTELALLGVNDSALNYSYGVIVDTASEVTLSATPSNVLTGRGFNPNTVITLASGLTAGWHTVRVRTTNASWTLYFSGIDIVNNRTNISILPGTAYNGAKQESLNSSVTSNFSAGVVGQRGARIVKYVLNGAISQAVQEVASSSSYLTLADHIANNEEIVKRVNFRDLGANRTSDDFQTLGAARGAAYTLDDNNFTLQASSAATTSITDYITLTSGTSMMVTFTGTGLDVLRKDNTTTASTDTYNVQVDGVTVGNLSNTGSTVERTEKICSGLPYGTHTVIITRTTAVNFAAGFREFIVYQPKKPSIPVGAVEIEDYNLVANYSYMGTPTNNTLGKISQGVIRHHNTREFTFAGSGWVAFGFTLAPIQAFESGWNLGSDSSGSYYELSFYGTGVDIRGVSSGSHTPNFTFSVDGSTNLTGIATYDPGFTGLTFTASTGVLSGTTQVVTGPKYNMKISGLTLGWHKVRVTNNAASPSVLYVDAWDVVTPIHMNHSSLKIGSMSSRDTRSFSPVLDKPEKTDLTKLKAMCVFDGVNNKMLFSYGVLAVLRSATGVYYVFLEKPFKTDKWVAEVSSNTYSRQVLGPVDGLQFRSPSTQYVQLFANGGTAVDGTFQLSCFGELEDEGDI